MHLIWRRYARAGYAPPWFYIVMAAAFGALAVWAAVRGDWLIVAATIVMAVVAVAGSRLMRRMGGALAASERRVADAEDGNDE